MADFLFYFQLGWHHIVSWDALDHLLFIAALVAFYTYKDIRQLLILATAFTVGHSLTLVLSALDIVRIDTAWVEFLIPLTITATAMYNLYTYVQSRKYQPSLPQSSAPVTHLMVQYFMAFVFGLVHGLGFANTARMMISTEESLVLPLLGFNCGIEIGQLVVIVFLIGLSALVGRFVRHASVILSLLLTVVAIALSLYLASTRIPF